jgi:hypothetical protein
MGTHTGSCVEYQDDTESFFRSVLLKFEDLPHVADVSENVEIIPPEKVQINTGTGQDLGCSDNVMDLCENPVELQVSWSESAPTFQEKWMSDEMNIKTDCMEYDSLEKDMAKSKLLLPVNEEQEQRIQTRKHKNRESAKLARERKLQTLKKLTEDVECMGKKIKDKDAIIAKLTAENAIIAKLKAENDELRNMLAKNVAHKITKASGALLDSKT